MKTRSVPLVSLVFKPTLVPALHMERPIKASLFAGPPTVKPAEVFPGGLEHSPRKRKIAVLSPQPTSSESELTPLTEEEPVVAKKPSKKKRKVATKTVVENEDSFGEEAEPVRRTNRKRKVKVAMAEEETLEGVHENRIPKKRRRKPKVIEPVVYDIPAVERKETTFKGKSHPQVTRILINGSFNPFQVVWDMQVSLIPHHIHWRY